MKDLSMVIISAIIIAGCTTPSTLGEPNGVQIRYSMFLGKTITRFILDNGTPYGKQILANGNRVYSWNSKNHRFFQYSPIRKDNMDYFVKSECEIRINTSVNGKIRLIYALRDDAKNWDPSECRDFLK